MGADGARAVIAIDSNVVLRLILGDDPVQLDSVIDAMARDTFFVPLTVFLEAGWVLQSRYRMSRNETADALAALLALSGVEVARPALADWAINRYRAGADLGDVVHLVAAAKHDIFLTFDRKLKAKAGRHSPVPIETLT